MDDGNTPDIANSLSSMGSVMLEKESTVAVATLEALSVERVEPPEKEATIGVGASAASSSSNKPTPSKKPVVLGRAAQAAARRRAARSKTSRQQQPNPETPSLMSLISQSLQ